MLAELLQKLHNYIISPGGSGDYHFAAIEASQHPTSGCKEKKEKTLANLGTLPDNKGVFGCGGCCAVCVYVCVYFVIKWLGGWRGGWTGS